MATAYNFNGTVCVQVVCPTTVVPEMVVVDVVLEQLVNHGSRRAIYILLK